MVAHKDKLLISLEDVPNFWRFTPVKHKAAFLDDWKNKPFTLDEVVQHSGTGVGLILGEISQTVAIDFDGPGSEQNFKNDFGFGVEDLPPTIAWSSGRPERHQRAYLVPQEWWNKLNTYKKTKKVEVRWNNLQSVLVGPHPNEHGDGQGFYSWLPNCSPKQQPLALAPLWFLERWAELSGTKTSGFSSIPKRPKQDLLHDSARVKRYLFELLQPANLFAEYEPWITVGMALHNLSQEWGDESKHYGDWVEWSSWMEGVFDEDECLKKWNSFGNSSNPKTFASIVRLHEEHLKEQAVEEPEQNENTVNKEPPLLRYRELRTAIYEALKVRDEDAFYPLVAEMWNRFRKSEKDLRPELFQLMREEFGDKNLTVGEIDINRVSALEYQLENFIPLKEIVQIYGPWGCGKTTFACGAIRALALGKGFLDTEKGLPPRKSLFIQSDAGSSRFKSSYDELNLGADPRFRHGSEEQMLWVWAADSEQGRDSWKADIWGIQKLFEEVPKLGVSCVFIDSVKGMTSGTGFNYCDNDQVKEMSKTLLRIAESLNISIVLLNHLGRDQGEASGAKAWSESAGACLEIKNVKVNNKPIHNQRELFVHKDSITGRRNFAYTLDDAGQFQLINQSELIKDKTNLIKIKIIKWNHELGTTLFHRQELLKIEDVSEPTLDRALKQLCKPIGGCLRKKGRGKYEFRAPKG